MSTRPPALPRHRSCPSSPGSPMTAVSDALVHVRLTTLLLCLRAFLFHCAQPQQGHAQSLGPPQVVIPLRVTGTHTGLRTPHWRSYSLRLEGKRHVVHIKVQKHLLARHMPVFSYSDQGALLEDHPFVRDDCYYHGYVEGHPESLVVLSTCLGGLQGTLHINNMVYEIEPKRLSTTFEHLVYRVESEETFPLMRCGVTNEEIARQWKFREDSNSTLMQSGYVGWWTHQQFVEMAVVVDHNRYLHKDSNISNVYTEVCLVMNGVATYYIPLEVEIVLIGIEVWTKMNPPLRIDDMDTFLVDFCQWKKRALPIRLPHDLVHLYVKRFYGEKVGLAYVSAACDFRYNCAVLSSMTDDLHGFAYTVAHELGHNVGMFHDEPSCTCGEKRCIMYAYKTRASKFSNCSYAEFWNFTQKVTCLKNLPEPDSFRHPRCGNSLVEAGEECDCGSLNSCLKDSCCQSDCTLTPGAACAFGLCCQDCQLRPSGALCRTQENECDLPEWCTGTSHLCPEDLYMQDGVPCAQGGHCYEKRCNDREEQCRRIFGKEAKSARHSCYREVNTRGDRFGHCGFNGTKYKRCDSADVLCGRIQCEGVIQIPLLSDHSTVLWTHFNGVTCWGTDYHFGMTVPDIGEVKDGTECGVELICIQRKCVPKSRLDSVCSPDTCNMKGVCNNRHHCHCNPGWAPPNCLEPGQGGSIDSDTVPPLNEIGNENSSAIVLKMLVTQLSLILIVLLILIVIKHLNRNSKLKRSNRKHSNFRSMRKYFKHQGQRR